MQKDFDNFVEKIDQDEMNTIIHSATQFSTDPQRQTFAMCLELLRRYDDWQKSE